MIHRLKHIYSFQKQSFADLSTSNLPKGVISRFYYPFQFLQFPEFCQWFCYVTCFGKIFLFCLFLSNMIFLSQNAHQVRCYHFFIVEIIIAESLNVVQMSKQKININMMENNQAVIRKYISKYRAGSFCKFYIARNKELQFI